MEYDFRMGGCVGPKEHCPRLDDCVPEVSDRVDGYKLDI